MAQPDTLGIDVRLTKRSDDSDGGDGGDGGNGGEVERGSADVRVSDEDGSPLPSATITLSARNGPYEESKSAKDHGLSQSFENVPMVELRVVIEATGYETLSFDVDGSDFGSDVTRGF